MWKAQAAAEEMCQREGPTNKLLPFNPKLPALPIPLRHTGRWVEESRNEVGPGKGGGNMLFNEQLGGNLVVILR